MEIWTATTDGDNYDLTTTVHWTLPEASRRVLKDMGIPFAMAPELQTDVLKLRESWESRMDGACIVTGHTFALPLVLAALAAPYEHMTAEALQAGVFMQQGAPEPEIGAAILAARVACAAIWKKRAG